MRTESKHRPPDVEGFPFVLHCNIKEGLMSAQKITRMIDRVALTFVNAALLAALPMAAVVFVAHSI